MICFGIGGAVPLLGGGFINDPKFRLLSVILASTVALAIFGAVGASPKIYASFHVANVIGCPGLLK